MVSADGLRLNGICYTAKSQEACTLIFLIFNKRFLMFLKSQGFKFLSSRDAVDGEWNIVRLPHALGESFFWVFFGRAAGEGRQKFRLCSLLCWYDGH